MYQLKLLLENASIDNEHHEIKRVAQYLNRNEGINISLKKLKELFLNADEVPLDKKIWRELENTESNTIRKGSFKKVQSIAKKYGKTDPNKLAKQLWSNNYDRPLIVKFKDRYHLVAGNTRLSTAAALGITPYVIIAEIPEDLTEQNTTASVAGYQSPNIFMATPPRSKDIKKKKSNTEKSVGKPIKRTFINTIPLKESFVIILNEVDLRNVEPYDTSNAKINKTDEKMTITAVSQLPNGVELKHQIEVVKPEVYDDEKLARATCMFYINDSIDILDKNKNTLGYTGLLKVYRTSFGFIKDIKDRIESICENEWQMDGIEYHIHGADKDTRKAEKKSNVYSNLLDFTFDDEYEVYQKQGKFEILKYFGDE
jgi:hypothetical protein